MAKETIVSNFTLKGREILSSYAAFTLEGEITAKVTRGKEAWTITERNGIPKGTSDGENEAIYIANDKAISAYLAGKQFPEGSIIGRVAWKMVPSEENNKIFGKEQSFVPGDAPDWYLQFMEKNSKKYASTGGWGYSNFGKSLQATTDKKVMYACFTCHQAVQARDYIFTKYSP